MKIRFASKVTMFQETFEHCDAINICYGKQKIQKLQGHVLDAHTWAVYKMVVETMLLVVKQCIFNQTQRC